MTPLEHAVEQLRAAILNPGPVPRHHYAVLNRHRQEWPTLWRAIDALLKEGGTPQRRPMTPLSDDDLQTALWNGGLIAESLTALGRPFDAQVVRHLTQAAKELKEERERYADLLTASEDLVDLLNETTGRLDVRTRNLSRAIVKNAESRL